MIAGGPLFPYSALFTKFLFWDSWKDTLGIKTKYNHRQKEVSSNCLWTDPPWR